MHAYCYKIEFQKFWPSLLRYKTISLLLIFPMSLKTPTVTLISHTDMQSSHCMVVHRHKLHHEAAWTIQEKALKKTVTIRSTTSKPTLT